MRPKLFYFYIKGIDRPYVRVKEYNYGEALRSIGILFPRNNGIEDSDKFHFNKTPELNRQTIGLLEK